MPERAVDRFEPLRLAGRGGMGEVWQARDSATGAVVALKLLLPAMADEPSVRERFEAEARLLGSLDCPEVVRFVAAGQTDGGLSWLAMEWLEGEDLAARLTRGPLSVGETLALARRAANALGALHERGFVHRDIKPSNLFLPGGDAARAVLLDLGIARAVVAAQRLTRTNTVIGTAGYMAPEQATGDASVDARADLFALGCVLHECLAGAPAFAGSHPLAILARVLMDEPAPLSRARADVPWVLAAAIESLLAKDPERRPPSAAAFVELLERAPPDASAPTAALALTQEEVRISTLLVARVPEGARAAAVAHLTERGEHPRVLVDGSVVAVTRASGAATDRAARTARAALALVERRHAEVVVVVTGRASGKGAEVLGPAFDRAASALASAHEPAALADDTTAALLGARFELAPSGALQRIVRERTGTEDERLLLGKATPFVGREREVAVIHSLFDESEREAALRVLLVIGEPGSGKSRLRREALRGARPATRVLSAAAESSDAGTAFALLRALLASTVGSRDGSQTAAYLRSLRVTPEPIVDPVARPRIGAEDPLGDAFFAWLVEELSGGPTMLALEDLHWADGASLSTLEDALARLGSRPVCVVAFTRPELSVLHPGLWSSFAPVELRLPRLSRTASEQLVRAVLTPVPPPETLARLLDQAAGNAFHLEEMVRYVAEGGDVTRMPDSVLAMVEARLDELDAPTRQVLRAASVVGESFSAEALGCLLEGATGLVDLQRALDRLIRAELVQRTRTPGEHAFRHALVRDAAYGTLPDEDRRRSHARAAAWLERGAGARETLRISAHLEQAGERQKALDTLIGASAGAAYDTLHDAKELLARARRLGASPEGLAKLVDLELLRLGWQRGRELVEEGAQLAEEALALADPGTKAWFRGAGALLFAGRHVSPERLATVILRFLERPLPDDPAAGMAVNGSVMGLVGAKQRDAARAVLAHGLGAQLTDPGARGWLLVGRTWLDLFVDGDIGVTLASMARAEPLFREARDPMGVVNALYIRAWAELEAGAYDDALLAAEEAVRASSTLRSRLHLTDHAQLVAACAELRRGDSQAASRRVAPLLRSEDWAVQQRAQHVQAAIALAEGRGEDAERLFQAGRHAQLAYALLATVGARAAAGRGEAGLARERLEKAVEAARRGATAPSLLAEAELELALAARATGDEGRAQEVAAQAVQRVRRTAEGLPEQPREPFLARHETLLGFVAPRADAG